MATSKLNPSNHNTRSITDVINDIGFGWYQVWQILLAGLVYFGLGCYVSMASLSTTSIATEWNLNKLQQSLLTSFFFVGSFVGSLCSGRIGDRWGRWWPIVTSNVVMTTVGFFSAFSPNWIVMALFRVIEGLAIGFGLPAIAAMTSEISPDNWKIAMRALNDGTFELGFIYTAVLGLIDEPHLQHLHWRELMMLNAVPGAVGIVTFFFLHESPAFLASKGQDTQARKVLEMMWRLNRGSNSEPLVDYAPTRETNEEKSDSAIAEYKVVFGKKYLFNTLSFSFICFCINIHFYGGLYMQAQVLGTSSEKVAAAAQMMIGGFMDLVGVTAAIVISRLLSPKMSTIFGLCSCAVTTVAFGLAGVVVGRNAFVEAVFQFGDFGFYWVPSLLFVVVYQFAIDSFPTSVCATGTGVVVASGRIGAIVGPQLFEYIEKFTGHWNGFCFAVAVAAAIGVVCVLMIKSPELEKSSTDYGEDDINNEKQPLLDKLEQNISNM